jgi:hypothetical protein
MHFCWNEFYFFYYLKVYFFIFIIIKIELALPKETMKTLEKLITVILSFLMRERDPIVNVPFSTIRSKALLRSDSNVPRCS